MFYLYHTQIEHVCRHSGFMLVPVLAQFPVAVLWKGCEKVSVFVVFCGWWWFCLVVFPFKHKRRDAEASLRMLMSR